jgi:hypothetical protein
MGRVTDVHREEVVQAIWKAPAHQRDHPADEADDDDRERPEREPKEMRDREQQAEEDRQAAPPQVVLDNQLNRMLVDGVNL